MSWACRGPASTAGLSSHCRICMSTLRKSDEKPVSCGTQRWGQGSAGSAGHSRPPAPHRGLPDPTAHGGLPAARAHVARGRDSADPCTCRREAQNANGGGRGAAPPPPRPVHWSLSDGGGTCAQVHGQSFFPSFRSESRGHRAGQDPVGEGPGLGGAGLEAEPVSGTWTASWGEGGAGPTWYWQSWRIRGQARKWCRCMDMTRAPPCGELSRVAMACRRRTAMPVTSGLPWRTRASSWPRACCSARATGRALEPCHRGPGLSGKIWSRRRAVVRLAAKGGDPPPARPGPACPRPPPWSCWEPMSSSCKTLQGAGGVAGDVGRGMAGDPALGVRAQAGLKVYKFFRFWPLP